MFASWTSLGLPLGASWRLLGPSWCHDRRLGRHLEPSERVPKPPANDLGQRPAVRRASGPPGAHICGR
eukprot:5196684-Pyramimonas_sp.AAC.1